LPDIITYQIMNDGLAIIIPYFKKDFFLRTLHSLKNQTDQRFKVYIGDDNSPHSIEEVFSNFNSADWLAEKVVYKKFSTNLGSKSLVKHWDRCVKLAKSEEWIWLFSDDDEMQPGCVSSFYKKLADTNRKYGLYKFNSIIINDQGAVLKHMDEWSTSILDPFDLIINKIKGHTHTFAVEYIFSRSRYLQKNGFVEFPLAWGSDDATWVKFSDDEGIPVIAESYVSWRLSDTNITGNTRMNGGLKSRALLSYGAWIIHHFKHHPRLNELKVAMKAFIIQQISGYLQYLSPITLSHIFIKGTQIWGSDFRLIIRLGYHTNKNALMRVIQIQH